MAIDHFRESGTQLWFEYHCNESDDSAHAEWWYRSHQKVIVLKCVNLEHGDLSFQERCEAACQLVYTVRFQDGFEGDVFEDELLDSPKEYERPAPPKHYVYYRKIGGGKVARLCLLKMVKGQLKTTHQYANYHSWKEAKKQLQKKHNAKKVYESPDMFKVLVEVGKEQSNAEEIQATI